MHVGEDDVVTVLEEVSKIYSIDRRRVYLTGASMGATGCWNLAAHYPHLFTGIVPVDWGSRHRPWNQQRPELTGRATAHQELTEFLSTALLPVSCAENLRYCQIAVVNAATDDVALMEQARAMVDRLRELAYPVDYLELPRTQGGASPDWAKEYALAKVFGKAGSERPTRFRHKTASLRHGRAWWIRMDRLDDPVRFATVEAELADGRAEITTDNVSAVTVLLEEAPTTIRQVCVDGAEFPVPAELDTREFHLIRWSGVWQRRTVLPLMKRKGLSGPFSDVLRDAFLVVYGTTSESEVQNEISYREAARFAAEWEKLYGVEPRLKADTEVNRRHLAELNLLLFGGPSVNAVAKQMVAELPVKIQGDAVRLGEDTYRGKDVGVMMCYPNPLSPKHMVALVAGTTPGALYQAYGRTGLWFDWRVYNKYKWFDYAVFDSRTLGPESFLAVGFFDNKWDFAPNGGSPVGGGAEWRADPEVVAGIQPQAFPALESAADSTDGKVCLSDVRPVALDQRMGAVGFDRSYAGGPVQIGDQTFSKGLGVRAPSRVSFALGGKFRRFRATAGVAPGAQHKLPPALLQAERVAFQVWGDGRLIETSAPLSWHGAGRSWQPIEADVRGIRVLTLVVQPVGGQTPLYSTAAWAAPTVIRYD
jgi:pimeloyl-ACP methyl ester carboxylesterase